MSASKPVIAYLSREYESGIVIAKREDLLFTHALSLVIVVSSLPFLILTCEVEEHEHVEDAAEGD